MAQVDFDLTDNCETFKMWLDEYKVAHTFERNEPGRGGTFFCDTATYGVDHISLVAKRIKMGEMNRTNATAEARKKFSFHRALIFLRNDVLKEEWGSERQIACQTLFFDLAKYLGYDWENDEEWHLKATLDESVNRALNELYPY